MSNYTIKDVAKQAKVSSATVSRVLNDPSMVSEATREKVMKVVNELNYKPNMNAKQLASHKSTNIALITSKLTRASIAETVEGIVQSAKEYDYNILLFNIHIEKSIEKLFSNILVCKVGGIIFITDFIEDEHIEYIKEFVNRYNIPILLANTTTVDDKIPSICIDYYQASKDLTNLLITEGRTNILFVSTVESYSVAKLKYKGYLDAMNEKGLKTTRVDVTGVIDENTPIFIDTFNKSKYDGVVCIRDSVAVSLINVLINKFEMNVPEEVSIVSFQNTKLAKLSRPNLTSIVNPTEEIGIQAMQTMYHLMDEEITTTDSKLIEYDIIKRGTTK